VIRYISTKDITSIQVYA